MVGICRFEVRTYLKRPVQTNFPTRIRLMKFSECDAIISVQVHVLYNAISQLFAGKIVNLLAYLTMIYTFEQNF